MSDRPSFVEQAESHLQQALEASDTATKNYHIRSALQVCACDGDSGQGKSLQTD